MKRFIDQQIQEFKKTNIAVKIIYINILVFVLYVFFAAIISISHRDWAEKMPEFLALHGDIQKVILKPWTLFTYSFFHGTSLIHLFFNMVTLYFLGKAFLHYFSEKTFLNIYILGGLAGAFLFLIITNLSAVDPLLFGASASIYAVMIALVTYQPNLEFQLLLIGKVKLWHIVGFIIVLNLLQLIENGTYNLGGLFSHIGGGLAGYFYMLQFNEGDPVGRFFERITGSVSANHKTDFSFTRKPRTADDYEYNAWKKANQAQVDAILDKIKKSGYNSLTQQEKEFLFKQK